MILASIAEKRWNMRLKLCYERANNSVIGPNNLVKQSRRFEDMMHAMKLQ